MKKILPIILACLFWSACSFHMEKRRYFPGYYISATGKTPVQSHAGKGNWQNLLQETKPVCEIPVSGTVSRIPERIHLAGTIPGPVMHPGPVANIPAVEQQVDWVASEMREKKILPHVTDNNDPLSRMPETDTTRDWNFLAVSGLLMTVLSAFFIPFIPRTRKIGYIAVNNRKKARIILFLLHGVMAVCGLSAGKWLHDLGISTTDATTWTLAGMASGITLLYPVRKVKTGFFRNTYFKQKLFSLLLNITGLLLFVNAGNRIASGNFTSDPFINAVQTEPVIDSYFSVVDPIEEDEPEEKAVKILLTVITSILGLLLGVLLAAGSCALACNGQEALAVMILVIGLPLIILLSVTIIKSIWKPRKEEVPSGQPAPMQG